MEEKDKEQKAISAGIYSYGVCTTKKGKMLEIER